jgi:hypothetical protein
MKPDTQSLDEIKSQIRKALSEHKPFAFFDIDDREASLPVRNYGTAWIDKATIADIRRVVVY